MRKFLLALFLALIAGAARAAVVYLKGGGQLEGAVVRSTDRDVVLDTSQGRVSIGLDRVDHIDYAAGAPAAQPPLAPQPAPQPYPEEYRVVRRRRWLAPEPYGPTTQTLSFDFGVAAPLSQVTFSGPAGASAADNGNAGVLAGVQYLYHPDPRLGWGLEFHYYDRSVADVPNLLPAIDGRAYGDTLLLLGVMKFSLSDRGAVRPYVLLGAGGYQNTNTLDARPYPGFAWSDTGTNETRTLVDDSAYGVAGSARLGLDFGYGGPGVFSLEAGWTGLTNASYSATGQGQALGVTGARGPLNYFTFAGRWGWDF